jgi:hypothetical protein
VRRRHSDFRQHVAGAQAWASRNRGILIGVVLNCAQQLRKSRRRHLFGEHHPRPDRAGGDPVAITGSASGP